VILSNIHLEQKYELAVHVVTLIIQKLIQIL
jgi:hypothetical protein